MYTVTQASTTPDTDHSVLSTLNQIPILDPNSFHNCRRRIVEFILCPVTTIPMVAVSLIIHFDKILTRGSNDSSRIKHHTRNRIAESKGVKDGTCSQIPYLQVCRISGGKKQRLWKTYPDAAIETSSHQMRVVEHQARNWTRMPNERPMYLTAPQVPQPDHPIRRPTGQSSIETLQGSHKICRRIGQATRHLPSTVVHAVIRRCLSCSPQYVERLNTATLLKIPLS